MPKCVTGSNPVLTTKIITTMALLILTGVFILACFFEKPEHKKAEKLPPFTKKQAEIYYYTELKNN